MFDRKQQVLDELVFINLNEGEEEILGDYHITSELPLPVHRDDLPKAFGGQEGVSWAVFARGMVMFLAHAPRRKHAEEYKKFLYAYNPNIEGILLSEGANLAQQGQKLLAADIFSCLNTLNPELKEAWFNQALCYQELGKEALEKGADKEVVEDYRDASVRCYRNYVRLDRNNPLAYYNLGFLYRHKGDMENAQKNWERALKLGVPPEIEKELKGLLNDLDRTDFVKSQFDAGVEAINNGKVNEGITLLEPLAKRFPDWWKVFYYIGYAYRNLEQFDKAKDYFEKVLDLNPRSAATYSELALCYYSKEDLKKAEQLLQKALFIEPDNAGFLANLGLVYVKAGDYSKAVERLSKALYLNPNDPFTQNYVAQLPEEYQKETRRLLASL